MNIIFHQSNYFEGKWNLPTSKNHYYSFNWNEFDIFIIEIVLSCTSNFCNGNQSLECSEDRITGLPELQCRLSTTDANNSYSNHSKTALHCQLVCFLWLVEIVFYYQNFLLHWHSGRLLYKTSIMQKLGSCCKLPLFLKFFL